MATTSTDPRVAPVTGRSGGIGRVMRLKPIVDLDLSELDALHRTNIRHHGEFSGARPDGNSVVPRLMSFLAGPDGHWVNGQNIRDNGGIIQEAAQCPSKRTEKLS